jgi:hypothetical protein
MTGVIGSREEKSSSPLTVFYNKDNRLISGSPLLSFCTGIPDLFIQKNTINGLAA